MTTEEVRKKIAAAIDAIEGAYEFFLAYAAQGLTKEDPASPLVGRLRRHLEETAQAVDELSPLLQELTRGQGPESSAELEAFRAVVEADAARAASVISLVRSRPSISSQLVDNLNASVHIRTLLTDLFILDEVLKLGVDQATTAPEPSESAT